MIHEVFSQNFRVLKKYLLLSAISYLRCQMSQCMHPQVSSNHLCSLIAPKNCPAHSDFNYSLIISDILNVQLANSGLVIVQLIYTLDDMAGSPDTTNTSPLFHLVPMTDTFGILLSPLFFNSVDSLGCDLTSVVVSALVKVGN